MFMHGKSLLIAFALIVGCASASIVMADQVYVEGTDSDFGLLNTQTGAFTSIGVTSVRIGGMGFAADGNLYGLADGGNLYRINTATGALTIIGSPGLELSPGWGAGTTSDGTFYAQVALNQLYTINLSTAVPTFVGATDFDSSCDPCGDANGNLYNAQWDSGSGFYSINRTTGVGTLIGSGITTAINALAFTNNTMYGFNESGDIYTINLATGVSTMIGTTSSSIGGIYSATGHITPIPVTVVIAPNVVTGGTAGSGTVTLSFAPTTNTTVTLASSNTAAATVLPSTTIPAGSTMGNFTITTHTVTPYTPVTITATANGVSKSGSFYVAPPGNPTFKLSPSSVVGGAANSTGTITVPGPAPAGGIPITMTSSDPAAASVPALVTIPAGQTSVIFTVTTFAVTTSTSVTITASSDGVTGSTNLTVRP